MSQDDGMDPNAICQTCALADVSCPVYPTRTTVAQCRAYVPSQQTIADRWAKADDIDGD